jgi:hypothetical protein
LNDQAKKDEVGSWVWKTLHRINQATFVRYMEIGELHKVSDYNLEHIYIAPEDTARREMYSSPLGVLNATHEYICQLEESALTNNQDRSEEIAQVRLQTQRSLKSRRGLNEGFIFRQGRH